MRYSLQKDIFNQEAYSHYFFMPVYNLFRLDEEIGLLAIGIRESDLRSVYSASTDENLSLYLTNENGKILSDPSYKNILTDSILADNTLYSQGELDGKNNQSLILYHQLSSPGWYMVGEISTNDLLKDSAALITVFISILIVGIGAGLVFIYFITRNLYRPVSELVKRIGQVSDGNLQVQIAENNFGQDFKHLLSSFNNMVQQIRLLIEQVKEEQRQVDKIKLNMLQSQIQPHFLYNVLDSIHWQAAYNKDKEVSNMLHTLASYYRLSLSKGSDVIPLRQELAMVKDYLTLQNMRYDNLVELDISVEDRWMELPIPKLTLQPLVENAIYHGFRSVSQKHGRLRISSKLINNDVLLIVEDDGKGISTEQALKLNKAIMEYDEDAGYGLRNVQKRFEIYFGAEYGLHITPNDTGGTSIYVFLPSSNLSQDIM